MYFVTIVLLKAISRAIFLKYSTCCLLANGFKMIFYNIVIKEIIKQKRWYEYIKTVLHGKIHRLLWPYCFG